MERSEQGRTSREGIAAASRESHEGIAGANREQRGTEFDKRFQGQEEGRAEHKREFDTKEGRLEKNAEFTKDYKLQQLGSRRDQAKMKAERDGRTDSLKEWESARKAHDNYERQKISASNILNAKDKNARLKELDAEWKSDDKRIGELKRQGAAGMGLEGGGAPQSQGSPPKEALQEGHITEFNNGQKWMLKNGQPEQVQ